MDIINILFICISSLNVVTFLIYGIDKYKAKRAKWRIPESTLLWLAICGGSIGALLGMRVWRHKTRHKKFRYGVPLIIVLQAAVAGYGIYWMMGEGMAHII